MLRLKMREVRIPLQIFFFFYLIVKMVKNQKGKTNPSHFFQKYFSTN